MFLNALSTGINGKVSISQTPTAPTVIRNTTNVTKLEKLITSLEQKIDKNTESVKSLKTSVDSMSSTITVNNTVFDDLIKKNTNSNDLIIKKLDDNVKKMSYSAVVGKGVNSQIVKSMPEDENTPRGNPKMEEIPDTSDPIKTALKNRQLSAGTFQASDHKLGKAVVINQPRPNKYIAPRRPKLSKSIYVSRIDSSVKVEDIAGHIKERIPEIKDDEFSLRLLVKKDQQMDKLTFVSFRLLCTESRYEVLISPSLWPAHVMIGDFLQKPSEKGSIFGDFLVPASEKSNDTVDLTNDNNETESNNSKNGETINDAVVTNEIMS